MSQRPNEQIIADLQECLRSKAQSRLALESLLREVLVTDAVDFYFEKAIPEDDPSDWDLPYDKIVQAGLQCLNDGKLARLAELPNSLLTLSELLFEAMFSPGTAPEWREAWREFGD